MNRGLRVTVVFVIGMAAPIVAAGCEKHEAQATAAAPVPVPAMKPAPPTPIDTKKAEVGGPTWDPEWDKIVELALPPAMLSGQVPHDVRRFCPAFYGMAEDDKRAFWAYFFQALAGAEAGLKPTVQVKHSQPEMMVKDQVTGRPGRTSGLLQLTYGDQERYGCDFDWEHDKKLKVEDPDRTILQPKNNLECGVKILDKQIIEKRKALLSASGYWSTLRPGTVSYRVFAKQMTNVPAACRVERGGRVASR
ncbi:hypothetical protein [Tunturiibacter gelidiferens]|uniref:hypothetical protein n=1 Tax=Tunturiibacter gelidiferens TaxID=3069689 RepID=UPI003D9B82CC